MEKLCGPGPRELKRVADAEVGMVCVKQGVVNLVCCCGVGVDRFGKVVRFPCFLSPLFLSRTARWSKSLMAWSDVHV